MKVSVIIPTLNEASNIGPCIWSVLDQNYPDIEIIVVDGESTDNTRLMAETFGATKIIRNPSRVQDVGKMLGIRASIGDVILMMDADNRLVGEDYIAAAVLRFDLKPFAAIGVESLYLRGPGMTSWNRYLTELLHISDPVTWAICSPPKVRFSGRLCQQTGAWPLGANGFFYRRSDLERAGALDGDRFEDCTAALMVAQHLKTSFWLRIPGCGVQHYHSRGPRDFVQKRKRQTVHYLKRRDDPRLLNKYSWMRKKRMPVAIACLYCVSIIGPLITMAWKICKTRRWEWLWHPIACLCSVYGLALGIRAYYQVLRDKEELGAPGPSDIWEASLQPARE